MVVTGCDARIVVAVGQDMVVVGLRSYAHVAILHEDRVLLIMESYDLGSGLRRTVEVMGTATVYNEVVGTAQASVIKATVVDVAVIVVFTYKPVENSETIVPTNVGLLEN